MKFNFKQLPQLFKSLTKSGMADDVAKFATNNADEVLDVVDDIPTSISFDAIADAHRNRIPMDKPPITPQEFVKNYQAQMPAKSETRQLVELFPEHYANAPTERDLAFLDEMPGYGLTEPFIPDNDPDFGAQYINPLDYGQDPDLIDSMEYPDGFISPDDFARYYEDLEQGFSSATHRRVNGRMVYAPDGTTVPDSMVVGNKVIHAPLSYRTDQDLLKGRLMERLNFRVHDVPYDFDPLPYSDGIIPTEDLVGAWTGGWRPHKNTGLGKFFKKHGRLPDGLKMPEDWDWELWQEGGDSPWV